MSADVLPCTLGTSQPQESFCMAFDFTVGAAYFLLILASARVLLVKISQEHERKWQIFFHGFLMLGSIGRCVYMFVLPFRVEVQSYFIVLNTLPSFFFFSAYFVFLFFWAELYHHNTGRMINFRFRYIALNVFFYVTVVALYIVDATLYPYCDSDGCRDDLSLNATEYVIHAFTDLPYLVLAVGYAFYGTNLFLTFARLPTGNIQKRDDQRILLIKLGTITSMLTVFFLLRFIFIILWLVQQWASVWYFDPLYFLLLEVFPVSMLFILFGLSSSSSAQNNQVTASAVTGGKDVLPVVSSRSTSSYGSASVGGFLGTGKSEVAPLLGSPSMAS